MLPLATRRSKTAHNCVHKTPVKLSQRHKCKTLSSIRLTDEAGVCGCLVAYFGDQRDLPVLKARLCLTHASRTIKVNRDANFRKLSDTNNVDGGAAGTVAKALKRNGAKEPT